MLTLRATRPLGEDGDEAMQKMRELPVFGEITSLIELEYERAVFRWAAGRPIPHCCGESEATTFSGGHHSCSCYKGFRCGRAWLPVSEDLRIQIVPTVVVEHGIGDAEKTHYAHESRRGHV